MGNNCITVDSCVVGKYIHRLCRWGFLSSSSSISDKCFVCVWVCSCAYVCNFKIHKSFVMLIFFSNIRYINLEYLTTERNVHTYICYIGMYTYTMHRKNISTNKFCFLISTTKPLFQKQNIIFIFNRNKNKIKK